MGETCGTCGRYKDFYGAWHGVLPPPMCHCVTVAIVCTKPCCQPRVITVTNAV